MSLPDREPRRSHLDRSIDIGVERQVRETARVTSRPTCPATDPCLPKTITSRPILADGSTIVVQAARARSSPTVPVTRTVPAASPDRAADRPVDLDPAGDSEHVTGDFAVDDDSLESCGDQVTLNRSVDLDRVAGCDQVLGHHLAFANQDEIRLSGLGLGD